MLHAPALEGRTTEQRRSRQRGMLLPHRPPVPQTASSIGTVTSVVPYLTVHDGPAALEFYAEAFGAEVVERYDDGRRLAHATVVIGEAVIMISDEYRDLGAVAPQTLSGATTAIVLKVSDPDTVYARAVGAGATAQRPIVEDGSGARSGWLVDPYGHRWNLRSGG